MQTDKLVRKSQANAIMTTRSFYNKHYAVCWIQVLKGEMFMSKREIGVGLLGLGTVGRGVYKILNDNKSGIEKKAGVPIVVKKVLVRDAAKDRGIKTPEGLLTTNIKDILDDPGIDIVVELLGGINPALEYSLQALGKGKSLVTANKDMIALHGSDLFAAAEACKRDL